MRCMLVFMDTNLAECIGLKITGKTLNKTVYFRLNQFVAASIGKLL